MEKVKNVRVDSEALEDQKAGQFQMMCWSMLNLTYLQWKKDEFRDYFTKFMSMEKLFPKSKANFPFPLFEVRIKSFMASFAIQGKDFLAAESFLSLGVDKMSKWLILPDWCHLECFITPHVYAILGVMEYKRQNGEDASKYEVTAKVMRDSLEMYEKVIPGTFRCCGIALQAQIALALKDKPFALAFEKMEKALEYATELACLPCDILILKLEIARWKGDLKQFKEAMEGCRSIGLGSTYAINEERMKQLESGEMTAVDLTFVPKVVEPILSDEERLEKLTEDLKTAKQEMKDAGTAGIEEAMQAARAKAKVIKGEIKKLKKVIADKSKPTVDQAKVDEIKAKIVEAQARQEQAFDDDDEEAEEAASAEIIKLGKELEALMSAASIPKQKLEDAKKTDAEINK